MDFGKILEQWNKKSGKFYDKDVDLSAEEEESPISRRRRLLRKKPEAIIDLHGLSGSEAWDALGIFFSDAKNLGLEKILIIHGKGRRLAEQKTSVLKKIVQDFIERCPFAGENGYSDGSAGGTGSTWVLLKKNHRSR